MSQVALCNYGNNDNNNNNDNISEDSNQLPTIYSKLFKVVRRVANLAEYVRYVDCHQIWDFAKCVPVWYQNLNH
ncbi:hypothetical protein NQ317_003268 [Molorchus minor]|uniref:Uncharacterized protein n=1 Tax=Molorchus minor TaxID=1323400 RepID=A0ABQ9JL31_9CUCU|nr:hypothetical protein NQ317_003268 [Molorchus minor]